MSVGFVGQIVGQALFQILMVSAPMLGLAVIVGLTISIFQATTSIQEQTLTFVPKIVVVLGAVMVFGTWILNSMIDFTMRIFGYIPEMIQ